MSRTNFPSFLAGGRMGELIRQKDWSKTALGALDRWPVSLRTTVNLLLNAKLPMLLWWGTESIQIFNDAYGSALSLDECSSWLGEPGEVIWKDGWSVLKTEINWVTENNEAKTHEDLSIAIKACEKGGIFCNSSFNPVTDDFGNNHGVLVICSEGNFSSKEKENIEDTQRQVLESFEQSPVGIAIFDRDRLVFKMANSFYGYLVGRDPKDIIGKPLFEALPELAGQGFEELIAQVFETGQPYIAKEVQVELLRNDHLELIYVDLTYQPRRDVSGHISGILVVVTEVTEQVLSRREIEDREKIFRDMILNAPIGICLMNASDLVSEIVNESFIEVAGKPYEQIIGKNYWIPFAEAREYYEEALDNVSKNGVPYFANEVPMMLVRHGKPEQIYVTFAYMPLIDNSGKVRKIAVWVLENTHQVIERKKIEEIVQLRTIELSAANDQLCESNELLSHSNENLERFAYVASHDLQEPLRKIQQFGDLLKREISVENNRQKMLVDKMASATQRMSILIRDVLEFSRISHQKAVSFPISLTQIVDQVLGTLEEIISESQASISVEPLPEIVGDPMQMDQLFQNLLSNALKFKKSGESPVIYITSQKINHKDLPSSFTPSRQSSAYYRIDVIDNGIGFDQEHASRIFQMFQRLHSKNEFNGTGIGLAISEKVVVNHGGALTAQSQIGKGATFSIYLPVPENHEHKN